jgi:predicted lipid-binding transport protein (Tim44 family)
MKRSVASVAVMIISLVIGAAFVWTDDAAARAGRGGSGGSRGARSQAAPARVAPPTSAKPAVAAPAPSDRWRTTTGWLAGGMLGGLLLGGSRDGIGLPDVAGIAVLAYIALRLLRRRTGSRALGFARVGRPSDVARAFAGSRDQVDGRGRAAFVDPSFDKSSFAELATEIFATVQQARAARDVQLLGMLVTPEMHAVLRRDCERMKSAGRAGHVACTEGRVTGVGDARVEAGHEEITVRVEARESADGAAAAAWQDAAGETRAFAEDWTFTRPRWAKAWRLSAIQPAAR